MSTELITQSSLFPPAKEWAMIKEQSALLVQSGLLPRTIDTPAKAVAIMLKGREMGIPPMQAFSHIAIIEGKPAMSAELQRAQIYRLVPGAIFEIEELTSNGCTILAGRPGRRATRFTWGPEDAKAAGLLSKQNWQKYPKAMYLARASSEAARAIFPDALMGCAYTPEELDPDAEVDEDGLLVPKPPAAAKVDLNRKFAVTPEPQAIEAEYADEAPPPIDIAALRTTFSQAFSVAGKNRKLAEVWAYLGYDKAPDFPKLEAAELVELTEINTKGFVP